MSMSERLHTFGVWFGNCDKTCFSSSTASFSLSSSAAAGAGEEGDASRPESTYLFAGAGVR